MATADSVEHDVVVVGDGPAGLALAAACAELGARAVVIGAGGPWTATYGTWRDDVPGLPAEVFAAVAERVVVNGARRHELRRPYGVFDNVALRNHLAADAQAVDGVATGVQHFTWGSRVLLEGGGHVDGAVVMDCTGGGSLAGANGRAPAAWQTAFGVVLDAAPAGLAAADTCTLMDFRTPARDPDRPPSFAYAVPTPDGWLVEETVLAAQPPVEPQLLRERLAARIGADVVATARRVEEVRIPMGAPLPRRTGRVVPFGAAAGYVHPATGYSVAASLRAAHRVAVAITSGGDVWEAVWPAAHRRARRLQRYGLDVILGLDADEIGAFFDAFFDLPVDVWSAYLRVDTTPGDVARAMAGVFSAAPARLRRRLALPRPAALARLLRG